MRGSPLILLDAGLVIAFAALGRRSHDEGVTLSGVVEVAAPFLIALAVGWLVARAWKAPAALQTGVVVWAVTVVLGLALRNAVFDRGVAVSFMIVAALTLGALLLGWRAAVRLPPVRRALPRA